MRPGYILLCDGEDLVMIASSVSFRPLVCLARQTLAVATAPASATKMCCQHGIRIHKDFKARSYTSDTIYEYTKAISTLSIGA